MILWILLREAKNKGMKNIQVMGDSKLAIDWENKKIRVKIFVLAPTLEQIKEVTVTFDDINFTHIFKEDNT